MNLLSKRLTLEEIEKCIPNLRDFRYSVTEGGFISNDDSVIFITSRHPYIGMLLSHSPGFDRETQDNWANEILRLISPKQIRNEQLKYCMDRLRKMECLTDGDIIFQGQCMSAIWEKICVEQPEFRDKL